MATPGKIAKFGPTGNVTDSIITETDGGSIGIGTAAPSKPLTIQAQRLGQELIGFNDPSGVTKWHINQNLGGSNPGLNFVETGVADGRLFLQAGGNVGIGTTGPNARLTVQTSGPDIGDFTFATGVEGTVINNRGTPDLWRLTAGVRGINNGGYGVQGQSDSFVGVEGISNSSMGVFGQTNSGIGVAGVANTNSGAAGVFQGSVQVIGTLSKSGGGFRIDHPLDSANKYLNHSFVESPEMKNVYDGVAVLDANGEAAVMLPDWFEALNEGFRYQLTPVGAPAPQLHIANEIADAQFRIAGGVPGQRVCWQVTGVRKDPWARAHPVVVEEPKTNDERGRYLDPELFGQGEDQSLLVARYPNFRRRQT